MKRILLIVFACVLSFPLVASHIVGGEFELQHVSGSTYRINLIIYFDLNNGDPGAKDQSATVRIYRMRDNVFMRDIVLPLSTEETVSYTQPNCAVANVRTSKLTYTASVTLSSDTFTDEEGYYLVWQRCCRNYTITNVISQDPDMGTYAGQTFYLEFPAVVKDGEAFYNSSPHLFPPLSDYGCVDKPYYVDFAGTDDDGDSLVYSLVAPLNTTTGDAVPSTGPYPRPYSAVTWRDPYSLDNIMGGNPDLSIDDDGFLRVTPTASGLFVFAVKCEEYRDGEKIGEVRRDFQLTVLNCETSVAPEIKGKLLADAAFTYDDTMTISFDNTTSDSERCIEVEVTDADSEDASQGLTEEITIKAVSMTSSSDDVSDILPDVITATLTSGSSVVFDICFDACPLDDGPYEIAIIAMDDACALPLMDTLFITIEVEAPENNAPYFVTSDITETLDEGETMSWTLVARDDDGDAMYFSVVPDGFVLADAGMSFVSGTQSGDEIQGTFTWTTECGDFNFAEQNTFAVQVVVEDNDECEATSPDVLLLNLTVDVIENHQPTLTITSLNVDQPLTDGKLTALLGDQITLGLYGSDPDDTPEADIITIDLLDATGDEVTPTGYVFASVQGAGTAETTFTWNPECSIFAEGTSEGTFHFTFCVYDDHCYDMKGDTVEVEITIQDVESSDIDEQPPNIITPNGDLCNDFFAMEGFDTSACGGAALDTYLPPDNCSRHFESIRIVNRWGKIVYESKKRDFRWHASGEPNGIYFYLLKFSDAEYKGSVTVRY